MELSILHARRDERLAAGASRSENETPSTFRQSENRILMLEVGGKLRYQFGHLASARLVYYRCLIWCFIVKFLPAIIIIIIIIINVT